MQIQANLYIVYTLIHSKSEDPDPNYLAKNLNFPQICPKMQQNGPKMTQSCPNMTPNDPKLPKKEPKWPTNDILMSWGTYLGPKSKKMHSVYFNF